MADRNDFRIERRRGIKTGPRKSIVGMKYKAKQANTASLSCSNPNFIAVVIVMVLNYFVVIVIVVVIVFVIVVITVIVFVAPECREAMPNSLIMGEVHRFVYYTFTKT